MKEKGSKKAHFIGIAGVGMGSTALLLRDSGWEITGSDVGFYPPMSTHLKDAGINFKEGYSKENIPKDADLIVMGKQAKLSPDTNEEARAAIDSGIEIKSFAQVLGKLTKNTKNIVVTGSYAKSTCTALLAHCLINAGKDPSYFIGAVPLGIEKTAKLGDGNVFVLEGDEYPSAHNDDRAKFLHYNTRDVLLTSASHDHINVFPTLEDYLKPFKELLESLPKESKKIICFDNSEAKGLAQNYEGVTSYGLNEGVWSAKDILYGEASTFALTKNGESIALLETTLLGAHNIQNIVGVSAILLEKELITPGELAEGVRTFKGVNRRLNLLTPKSSIPVYEGFGSSFEKARAGFEAMKVHFPKRKIVTVFEPHTFSLRNKGKITGYDYVFDGVDEVLVYKPAEQGAATHAQLTLEEIVERASANHKNVRGFEKPEKIIKTLEEGLSGDEVIILMTSGDLDGLIEEIPKLVTKKHQRR
ncbi:MAG: Mur ligase family protein [Candidatus Pacebacteria bacterium]|jgi:UDP-N-acetylmuramate: L-alanyl-gamma-D-glutamyl-meso-diaminopimelate ligase|nr:hypothetical protein [bacterium]MDP6527587.1 Mur ligase family protein [Candidatus Paceibacterota bacterium]MDP6659557.1 Mur ligase family protein [Candidatus Paceibacterota bacterium]|tara:strand:+ start:56587 stop:58008 length:1422 start_codon:yes stop_codon:yes gene_type:complete